MISSDRGFLTRMGVSVEAEVIIGADDADRDRSRCILIG